MRLILSILLLLLTICDVAASSSPLDRIPSQSEVLPGYRRDSVGTRLKALPLHAVEGLWEFTPEGTVMAIERVENRQEQATTLYRMVVVKGADLALRPGTVMGYLVTTSKRGVYDARIYTARRDEGTTLSSPKKFTLTLTDEDSRLTVKGYGKFLKFNWWRLLPYMYRYLVSQHERSPGDIKGCVRIYPEPAHPLEPRYL